MIDHWSNFNFAFPAPSKEAQHVAHVLRQYVFPYFGGPKILHSDNGREFVNSLVRDFLEKWPGKIQMVTGRPRHPQSQGLIEQAHYTLQRMMSAKMKVHFGSPPPWASWLPHMICKYDLKHLLAYLVLFSKVAYFSDAMNTQVHSATGETPYEIVFGQPSRSLIFPDVTTTADVIQEEDLEIDVDVSMQPAIPKTADREHCQAAECDTIAADTSIHHSSDGDHIETLSAVMPPTSTELEDDEYVNQPLGTGDDQDVFNGTEDPASC